MNTNKSKCIYCGKNDATEKDHVPPQCFFPSPRPSNLITVPSCSECNREFGKIDERMRNILSSLDTTENHQAIKTQIADKRNKSYKRAKGTTNLKHLTDSIFFVDIFTPSNIYIGKKPAFNLDQPIVSQFFERIGRALLFKENNIEYFEGSFDWKLSYTNEEFHSMPQHLGDFFAHPQVLKEIGDNVFFYAGWYLKQYINSIWIVGFYGGIEFMLMIKEEK